MPCGPGKHLVPGLDEGATPDRAPVITGTQLAGLRRRSPRGPGRGPRTRAAPRTIRAVGGAAHRRQRDCAPPCRPAMTVATRIAEDGRVVTWDGIRGSINTSITLCRSAAQPLRRRRAAGRSADRGHPSLRGHRQLGRNEKVGRRQNSRQNYESLVRGQSRSGPSPNGRGKSNTRGFAVTGSVDDQPASRSPRPSSPTPVTPTTTPTSGPWYRRVSQAVRRARERRAAQTGPVEAAVSARCVRLVTRPRRRRAPSWPTGGR